MNGAQSITSPAGPASSMLATLFWAAVVVFAVVALVTGTLLVIAAVKKKGSLAAHDDPRSGGGHRWLLWGGVVVPVVILVCLFAGSLEVNSTFPLHSERDHGDSDIRLTGRQWWWEVEYLNGGVESQVKTANEIHIPVGWTVELELVSRDVIHSFWVPNLHGKVDLVPGRVNHVRIQADKPGVFEGQCAEFCGDQHAMMRLVVVAEPLEDYQRWLKNQAQPAVTKLDEQATNGQLIFETKACALCHTVRGTESKGSVGPDLTHVASRHGLAAMSLPNNHAYLEAWAVRAQSLKPGALMPDLDEFSGEELQSLTHYLESLE